MHSKPAIISASHYGIPSINAKSPLLTRIANMVKLFAFFPRFFRDDAKFHKIGKFDVLFSRFLP